VPVPVAVVVGVAVPVPVPVGVVVPVAVPVVVPVAVVVAVPVVVPVGVVAVPVVVVVVVVVVVAVGMAVPVAAVTGELLLSCQGALGCLLPPSLLLGLLVGGLRKDGGSWKPCVALPPARRLGAEANLRTRGAGCDV